MSQPETQLPKNEPVARPKNITVYCLIDDSVLNAFKRLSKVLMVKSAMGFFQTFFPKVSFKLFPKSGKDGPSMAMEIPNRQNKTMI